MSPSSKRFKANCYLRRLIAGTSLTGLLWLLPCLLSADTILLKSGQVITGTWVGASNREVRIAVGDRVQTIAISDIARIDFADSTSPSSAGSGPAIAVPAKPNIANKQAKSCDVVAAYRAELMRVVNEPNPIVRAGLRKPDPADYNGRLVAILGTSGAFDSWRGTVRFHVTGQWVVLEFTPDCKPPQGITFSTAHSVGSEEASQTLIPLNSPLARSLSRVKSNDPVIASGHLFYTEGKPAYRGSSDNPNPSVAAPRYLAQFNNVTAIQK